MLKMAGWIKGFSGSEVAEDQVKKLGHDSADDDDRLLTFGSKSFCKGLAGWIVSHGAHGWIEERFA